MKIVLLILLGVFILYVIVINSLNTPKRIKKERLRENVGMSYIRSS